MKNSYGPKNWIIFRNALLVVKPRKIEGSTKAIVVSNGKVGKYIPYTSGRTTEVDNVIAQLKTTKNGVDYLTFEIADAGTDVPIAVNFFDDSTKRVWPTLYAMCRAMAHSWVVEGEKIPYGNTFSITAESVLPIAVTPEEAMKMLGETKSESETTYSATIQPYCLPDAEVLHHATTQKSQKEYCSFKFVSCDDGMRKDSTCSFRPEALERMELMSGDQGVVVTSARRRMINGKPRQVSYLQALTINKRNGEMAGGEVPVTTTAPKSSAPKVSAKQNNASASKTPNPGEGFDLPCSLFRNGL